MNFSRDEKLVRMKRVIEMTTLSRTTLWRMVRQGRFPQPVKISRNRVAWREYDVVAWFQTCKPAIITEEDTTTCPGIDFKKPGNV